MYSLVCLVQIAIRVTHIIRLFILYKLGYVINNKKGFIDFLQKLLNNKLDSKI